MKMIYHYKRHINNKIDIKNVYTLLLYSVMKFNNAFIDQISLIIISMLVFTIGILMFKSGCSPQLGGSCYNYTLVNGTVINNYKLLLTDEKICNLYPIIKNAINSTITVYNDGNGICYHLPYLKCLSVIGFVIMYVSILMAIVVLCAFKYIKRQHVKNDNNFYDFENQL